MPKWSGTRNVFFFNLYETTAFNIKIIAINTKGKKKMKEFRKKDVEN